MRLINAKTYELEEFWDEHVKEYAILSHRWEGEEVSFKDMRNLDSVVKKKGFAKIALSCKKALQHGLAYIWVDTCCIDKKSSAELSEAINSMFRWYKASNVCYAFLSDVTSKSTDPDMEWQVRASEWFSRGWTLQELIAPRNVIFYNQKWERLGTRKTMRGSLSSFTGIEGDILGGEASVSMYSIAQRMSWASQRTTTRIEDTAYCLLGIFDVNMPMLYGEGNKAFFRLQQEIIKNSDDHSIFAWPINGSNQTGLLAKSPKSFETCRYTRAAATQKGYSPYSLTNRGLSIKLLAAPYAADVYLARLNCFNSKESGPMTKVASSLCLGIYLRRLYEDDQYARVEHEGQTFSSVGVDQTFKLAGPPRIIEFNIRQHVTNHKQCIYGFRIFPQNLITSSIIVTAQIWDHKTRIMALMPGHGGEVGTLDFRLESRNLKFIKLGFDFKHNPVCFVAMERGLRFSERVMDHILEPAEEQIAQFLPIERRNPYDELGWSFVDGNSVAKQLSRHQGLWALKGDRASGLSVILEGLGNVRILPGDYEDKHIWDVHFDFYGD